jgi:hypothetical protein
MNRLLLTAFAALSVAAVAVSQSPNAKMTGTFLLNGKDRVNRFVLRKDGSFAFVGADSSSKGRWASDGQSVKFVWTEIDKQKVAPGKVKGSFPLTDDGGFKINKYVYKKP